MPMPLAAATFGMNAAGTVINFLGGQASSRAENRYRAEVARQQQLHFYEVQRYQNDVWRQDLEYAQEVLNYSRSEFDRQTEWAEVANAAVEKNRNSDAFTLMVRGIEETIAATFQTTSAQSMGRAARARFAAAERNVEGNSTEAVLGEIFNQEGRTTSMIELNRENTLRQLEREGISADASADQQLYQISSSLRTFSPNPQVRGPSPLNPVAPAQMVNGPNAAQLISGLFNAGTSAVSSYNAMSGQNAQQTYQQFSNWVSRQFTL